jgi:hypothetical protein
LPLIRISIGLDFNNFTGPVDFSLISPAEFANSLTNLVVKLVSVVFEPQLDFKAHISSVLKKILKSLYVLCAAKNILIAEALKSVYY